MSENSPIVSIDQSNADEAYLRVLPEAQGLDPDSLLTINLDVPTCIITAMGVIENAPGTVAGALGRSVFETRRAHRRSESIGNPASR